MSKPTARTELLGAAIEGGWQIEYLGNEKRAYGDRTVSVVRVFGGERAAEIKLEFTADTDAYVTATYSARGSSDWKRMTKAEVKGQLLSHGPANIARREAERQARHEVERQEREAKNLRKEQERSAERTRLQGEVHRVVNNIASGTWVDGRHVPAEPSQIALEIVCLLQQGDSPLVALVDAWRDHLAAEAGVRADALERQALASLAAKEA